MAIERLRAYYLRDDLPTFAPDLLTQAGHHVTLRRRIEIADRLLEQLDGALGDDKPLVEAILAAANNGQQILKAVHDSWGRAPDATTAPDAVGQYGFDHARYRGRNKFVGARVAICMAAELAWMEYAEGVVSARAAVPVSSLRTDLHSLALALNGFCVADYPALAQAFGAALDAASDEPARWISFERLVFAVVEPHLGGSFASDADRGHLEGASRDIAAAVVRRFSEGGVPPFFTAPRLTGVMVAEIDRRLPDLRLAEMDFVGRFESSANDLVFSTLRAGYADPGVLQMLDQLHTALEERLGG